VIHFHQLMVLPVDFHYWGENSNNIEKTAEVLLDSGKEVCQEVSLNTE
jgi:hypothetical protein